MVAVRVYVEGGGDVRGQQAPLRVAVATWIANALPDARIQPKVVACGPRKAAFEEFSRAVDEHPNAFCILLVDSEEPVTVRQRWEHVKQRKGDGWPAPRRTGEDNLHFMAQTMEAWLCADPEALDGYFGEGFKRDCLPKRADLELVAKSELNSHLAAATRHSRRGAYRKGAHLDALGFVSPEKVMARCASARVFVEVLRKKL